MADIFLASPGQLAAQPNANGPPITLFIDGWGGFSVFKAILSDLRRKEEVGIQITHTLRDFLYLYAYGDRIGTLTLHGWAFWDGCAASTLAVSGNEETEEIAAALAGDEPPPLPDEKIPAGAEVEEIIAPSAPTTHGIEWVYLFYLYNRATYRPAPLYITFGSQTAIQAFLVSFSIDGLDQSELGGTGVISFTLELATIPPEDAPPLPEIIAPPPRSLSESSPDATEQETAAAWAAAVAGN